MPSGRRPIHAAAFSLACAALAASCAPTHPVRPLGRGNAALYAALGGPLVTVGSATIPTPILSVGGAYGARDDAEVTIQADATAALFGVLHLDPGVAYHPIVRERGPLPTLTVAASLHLLTNFRDTRLGPQLTLAGAWRLGRRTHVYAGADGGVATGSPARLVVGPLAGGEVRLSRRFGLGLEAKWLAPYYDVAPLAPSWVSPESHGYFSVLLGLAVYLGDVP